MSHPDEKAVSADSISAMRRSPGEDRADVALVEVHHHQRAVLANPGGRPPPAPRARRRLTRPAARSSAPRGVGEVPQRGRFDLADAFPGDAHPPADRLEGQGRLITAAEAEAVQDDLALLGRQVVEQLAQVRLPAEQVRDGGGAGLVPVGDDVPIVAVFLFAA